MMPQPTERELQTLRLAALGYSNKEIAVELSLSIRTVEVHKTNALGKLSISGRRQLVGYGIRQGWFRDAESPDEKRALDERDRALGRSSAFPSF